VDSLSIAKEMEAMAQTGLHFCQDPFDRERYTRLRELAAELLAAQSNLSPLEILAWSKAEFGYATPKVDVRGFILSEGKILLVRENADQGRWTLPGGWADVNETPSESVVREVREESGYLVEPLQLLAVLDRTRQGHQPAYPYHIYKLFFHCRIIGGAPCTTLESSESGFFPVDALPELSLGRVLPQQLRDFHARLLRQDPTTRYD
jgi:ADP-ribose pyrophosphatase YjhB (NUDIX family)